MAGEISGLTLLEAPSGPLQAEVLDAADTTMSSNGTNKRAFLAGPYLIQTITNSSPGEFNFSSIPAGFRRLIIRGEMRGDVAATTDTIRLFFNGDTTIANYESQQITNTDTASSFSKADNPFSGVAPAASAPANSYGSFEYVIEGYAGGNLKSARLLYGLYYGADAQRHGLIRIQHNSLTAAITQVQIRTDNHPTDQLLGTLSLYGEF